MATNKENEINKDINNENIYENASRLDLGFEVKEAYKFLRANIMFSMPDTTGGRVIAFTSSMRSEGKSTTCINLSNSLSETEKKILLIECDLRLPVVSKRLSVKSKPGLANAIMGMCELDEAIQKVPGNDNFYVITAGSISPNPSELLASKSFENILERLRQQFDYVIMDLPPVTIVSDALVVSKYVDGFVIVVRQDISLTTALKDTLSQMSAFEDKILGFVYTSQKNSNKKYYSKSKYKSKYTYYSSEYGNATERKPIK